MNKSWFLIIFYVIASIFLVIGCTSPEKYHVLYEADKVKQEQTEKKPKTKEHYRIAYIPKVGNIPYFESVYEGVKEAAEQLEIEIVYEGPLKAEAELQSEIVEKMMGKKVDAIAVSVIDSKSLSSVLKKAKKQGIKIVTWDADSQQEARDLFVDMVDSETLGRHLMDQLALHTGEDGEFAIMTGSFSAINHNSWVKWIQAQWQQYYPNMKLVEVVATNDDPEIAYEAAKTLLKKYPNLKGIIGNSSVGPPAAAQVVKEQNKVGQVAVVGLSTPNLMRNYLLDGSAQTVTLWSPKKLGYLTIILTEKILAGEPINDYEVIPGVGIVRFYNNEHRIVMGEAIDFTKENVNQYDF
ncbi:autoinducer 2 ABC transporter substrate-binding protein [Viridibacillus arvi]|uniref:autoinducer 2 ABC transporter substrate-binding protein n=1 Tax=Viridibacillus arvi TaxID=263475 RepID=UPI003695B7D3